jgi:hypothetical protein
VTRATKRGASVAFNNVGDAPDKPPSRDEAAAQLRSLLKAADLVESIVRGKGFKKKPTGGEKAPRAFATPTPRVFASASVRRPSSKPAQSKPARRAARAAAKRRFPPTARAKALSALSARQRVLYRNLRASGSNHTKALAEARRF